jgi:hypothetical protein
MSLTGSRAEIAEFMAIMGLLNSAVLMRRIAEAKPLFGRIKKIVEDGDMEQISPALGLLNIPSPIHGRREMLANFLDWSSGESFGHILQCYHDDNIEWLIQDRNILLMILKKLLNVSVEIRATLLKRLLERCTEDHLAEILDCVNIPIGYMILSDPEFICKKCEESAKTVRIRIFRKLIAYSPAAVIATVVKYLREDEMKSINFHQIYAERRAFDPHIGIEGLRLFIKNILPCLSENDIARFFCANLREDYFLVSYDLEKQYPKVRELLELEENENLFLAPHSQKYRLWRTVHERNASTKKLEKYAFRETKRQKK